MLPLDLYYRLNVFAIFIRRSRRKPDSSARGLLLEKGRWQRKHIKRISTPAIDMLMAYHWPGTFETGECD